MSRGLFVTFLFLLSLINQTTYLTNLYKLLGHFLVKKKGQNVPYKR